MRAFTAKLNRSFTSFKREIEKAGDWGKKLFSTLTTKRLSFHFIHFDSKKLFSYPFVFRDDFVQLLLFPVVVKEFLALLRCFGSVEFLRYHSPISARIL